MVPAGFISRSRFSEDARFISKTTSYTLVSADSAYGFEAACARRLGVMLCLYLVLWSLRQKIYCIAKIVLDATCFICRILCVAVQYIKALWNLQHRFLAYAGYYYGDDHVRHTRTNRRHEQGRRRGHPRFCQFPVRRFRAPVCPELQCDQVRVRRKRRPRQVAARCKRHSGIREPEYRGCPADSGKGDRLLAQRVRDRLPDTGRDRQVRRSASGRV